MTSLVLAVGNSTTTLAVLREMTVVELHRLDTHALPLDAEIVATIERLRNEHSVEGAVMCSVVPDVAKRLAGIHDSVDGHAIVTVDTTKQLWFDSRYETMDTLGADRWCGVIAAREEYGFPTIVVDCGTALTINVIDPEGNFAGGNILPGFTTSFRSLVRDTAQLPDVRRGGIPPIVGTNTLDAIRAGVIHTISQGVEGVIREIEYDYHGAFRMVLTGGDASSLIVAKNRNAIRDPDLVLKGAARYLRCPASSIS